MGVNPFLLALCSWASNSPSLNFSVLRWKSTKNKKITIIYYMPYKLLLGTAIEECTVLPDLHSVHFLKLLKRRNQIIHRGSWQVSDSKVKWPVLLCALTVFYCSLSDPLSEPWSLCHSKPGTSTVPALGNVKGCWSICQVASRQPHCQSGSRP